jgi:hypothetical protein
VSHSGKQEKRVIFGNKYEQTLIQFLQGPFIKSKVNSVLESWEEQICSARVETSQAHDGAISLPE